MRRSKARLPLQDLAAQFLISLTPLGAALWISHFTFHLFSASHAPIPIVERILTDLQVLPAGFVPWLPRSWAFPEWMDFEILLLDLGFLLSLLGIWRTARRLRAGGSILRLAFPWAGAALLLFLAGLWLIFQPMQMRGLMVH